MAFRLEQTETVAESVRRIAAEQIEGAIADLLEAAKGAPDEPIHDLRKRLKKLRGLLRLVRPELGEENFQRENACFREAARELSLARTATAVLASFHALVPDGGFEEIRRALENEREHAVAAAIDAGRIREVESTLSLARRRIETWPACRNVWRGVERGLRRSYRDARDAFHAAHRDPTTEHLHEWRKRTKDHWYHVRLLTRIWHEPMRARRKALKRLSVLLGDDHDLADLAGALSGEPSLVEDHAELEQLLALVADRQAALRAEAWKLGHRLYAERSKHLTRRLGAYYAAWRAGAPASDVTPADDQSAPG